MSDETISNAWPRRVAERLQGLIRERGEQSIRVSYVEAVDPERMSSAAASVSIGSPSAPPFTAFLRTPREIDDAHANGEAERVYRDWIASRQ